MVGDAKPCPAFSVLAQPPPDSFLPLPAMNVMDPFTYDLLARPLPPCLFGAVSGGAALQTEERTELLNAYPRAIGVLPQLSPADFPPIHMYGTPVTTLKASVELPASCELYNAALEAFVQPAIEVPVPPGPELPPLPARAAPVSDGAALQTEERTELPDAYLRAIGVLPQLSPADFPPIPMYGTPVTTLKASVELPASCELYNAALEAFVQLAIEVPVPPELPPHPARAAPVSDGATLKNSRARPQLCPSYDADIDANLRTMEKDARERPSPDYLATTQGGQISPLTRAILVGWMDKFARHYDLAPGTLHRAVSYMDRFLSVRALASTSDYQLILLGAVAVFLAAKYEDQSTVRKLNATEIVRYGGFTTRQEVLHMESTMVAALGYQLGGPTAYTFVEHFTRYSQGEEDLQVQCLAHQLADQSLLHHGCLWFLPSAVAASAIFLGRLQTLSRPDVLVPPWNRELHELTGYKPMDLIDCVHSMYMLIPSPRFELLWVFFEDP